MRESLERCVPPAELIIQGNSHGILMSESRVWNFYNQILLSAQCTDHTGHYCALFYIFMTIAVLSIR